MTFTVLSPEYTAGCRRRQAAGEDDPVAFSPPGDPGEDPGWFCAAADVAPGNATA
jgi:hypothetical protein